MRADIQACIEAIERDLSLLERRLDLPQAEKRLAELNARIEDPDLWNDRQTAEAVMRQRASLEQSVSGVRTARRALEDEGEMAALAEAEDDEATLDAAADALNALRARLARMQTESLLSGEADGRSCFLEVHAGAGGTESQDWAAMLLRMYLRWAEARGHATELVEESAGEEAGIKSATARIRGERAYGWLKTESGVHRLVRISPFDAQARRHTSFASVTVYPEVEDDIEVDVQDKDLRVDTYRASGAGGQHVNRTDSAVRITHLPTGIVVQCQNDRSQHKNRATAMTMLRARLYEEELRRREEADRTAYAAKSDIGWGHQIRSYVLHPYQMVKDLRTQVETSDAQKVLDGDIDRYLEAALAARVEGATATGDGQNR